MDPRLGKPAAPRDGPCSRDESPTVDTIASAPADASKDVGQFVRDQTADQLLQARIGNLVRVESVNTANVYTDNVLPVAFLVKHRNGKRRAFVIAVPGRARLPCTQSRNLRSHRGGCCLQPPAEDAHAATAFVPVKQPAGSPANRAQRSPAAVVLDAAPVPTRTW